MNDTERILSAINETNKNIAEVSASLTTRMNDIEKRVEACEKSTERKIRYQNEEIEALRRKVEELAHSDAAVWKSRDELEIGIDRETAYEAFRELGIRRRDALKALEAMGILVRGSGNLTKAIRIGDSLVRAVVVMDRDF
jgi:chromosome segregation ATPase